MALGSNLHMFISLYTYILDTSTFKKLQDYLQFPGMVICFTESFILACQCGNLKNRSVGTTGSTVPFCYNYLFVTGHLPSASHYSTVTSHSLSFLVT